MSTHRVGLEDPDRLLTCTGTTPLEMPGAGGPSPPVRQPPPAAMVRLAVLLLLLGFACAGTLRYDQTQTGDTNIHLQIKNVEVLALLDDSAGAEYDYDYNDFTEKPPKPGAAPNVTFPTPPPVATASNSSVNTSSTSAAPSTSAASSTAASSTAHEEPLLSSTAPPDPSTATTKKTRRCGAGFYRDTLGRCRRIRRPHLQALMKLMKAKTTEKSKTL